MKKFFLLAAMVGVALTGCMKDEVYVPKCETPISFEVANYVAQTRASGAFSTTETFGVNAWSRDAAASSSVQMMKDEVVSYADGKWTTKPTTYYWPINGTVDFIAYYPTTVKPTIVHKYEGGDTYTYTDYTVVDGVDLMYADKAIRFSKNNTAAENDTALGYGDPDPLVNDYGFAGVPTLFRHALAKVNFKVQNGKPTDGVYSYDIKVDSITLNVYKQGSVTLTSAGTTPATRGTWSVENNVWTPKTGSKGDLTWTEAVTLSDGTAKDYATRTQYVLPQTLTAGDQKITVNYTVTQYQNIIIDGTETKTKISEQTYNTTLDLYSAVLPRWQMNKNITYTISLSSIGTQILFAPAVEEWETASGNVTIQ